jgi:hypothetical protein
MIQHEAIIKYLRMNKGLQPLAQPLEMDEEMEHSVLTLLCDVIEEKGFVSWR